MGWREELDKAEAAFVAWFKKKYRREPTYRDVEKRWEEFNAATGKTKQEAH